MFVGAFECDDWLGIRAKYKGLRPNSLRSGTGNLFRPSRELNRAIREIIRRIRDFLRWPRLRRKPSVRALAHDELYPRSNEAVSKNAVPCGVRGFGSHSLQRAGHYSASARREAIIARAVYGEAVGSRCPLQQRGQTEPLNRVIANSISFAASLFAASGPRSSRACCDNTRSFTVRITWRCPHPCRE